MRFRNLDDADVKGKRVLLRVDLNVPMLDGVVTDATRIEEIAPTIAELAGKGGKVILLSHFGRPKGPDPKASLRPVAAEVARIVKQPVTFAEDCVGPLAETAIAKMRVFRVPAFLGAALMLGLLGTLLLFVSGSL